MRGPLVIIINGAGGAGKDTICNILKNDYVTYVYSSITPIKAAATMLGWEGEKTQKARKFLSDIKDISTAYNNLPFRYMAEKLEEVEEEDSLVIFHIREPKEIEKFKVHALAEGYECKTLLIRTNRIKDSYGNHADDDVEKYDYDMVFDNDGRLEDLESDFMQFYENAILGMNTSEIKGEEQ